MFSYIKSKTLVSQCTASSCSYVMHEHAKWLLFLIAETSASALKISKTYSSDPGNQDATSFDFGPDGLPQVAVISLKIFCNLSATISPKRHKVG